MREATEPESDSSSHFAQRLVIDLAAAQTDVEGDIVANLPDRADQHGPRFRAAEVALVEELGNRPHLPAMRTFDDGAECEIGMLLARQGDLCVEVDGEPGPALRHD